MQVACACAERRPEAVGALDQRVVGPLREGGGCRLTSLCCYERAHAHPSLGEQGAICKSLFVDL
jgi:hypothetical protein